MLNQLRDVFKSLENHEVKYLVIGGIAAILHGVPRATFDLDIIIESNSSNAEKLLNALLDAKLATADLITVKKLLESEITIFEDRVRIDVQTSTPGIRFKQAWKNRKIMKYQGQNFFVLSREDLIASKLAAGRPVDLEDVRLLRLTDDQE